MQNIDIFFVNPNLFWQNFPMTDILAASEHYQLFLFSQLNFIILQTTLYTEYSIHTTQSSPELKGRDNIPLL